MFKSLEPFSFLRTMEIALLLLAFQGVIGAFDTLYYHEWRARLPAMGSDAADELQLHAARDVFYAFLFGTLPWFAFHGNWMLLMAFGLVAEIILTMWDFIIEFWVRKPLGDVYPGERVTHGIMGIVYGGMLAYLIPVLHSWWHAETALLFQPATNWPLLRWALTLMAAGVLLSGIRDLYASLDLPGGHFPWSKNSVPVQS